MGLILLKALGVILLASFVLGMAGLPAAWAVLIGIAWGAFEVRKRQRGANTDSLQ